MSLSTIDHLRLVHSSESQVPTVIKTYLTQVLKTVLQTYSLSDMSFPTQAMLYNHLTSGRSLSTILIIHHTSESSTFILLPKEVF